MNHVIRRVYHKVSHHLSRLRVLNMDVLLLAHGLHEILMHQLPDLPPRLAIVHNEEVIALGDQSRHDRSRSVAVNVAFLVEQIFDQLPVGYDECGVRESLQAENPSEFSRPLRQPDVCEYEPPAFKRDYKERKKKKRPLPQLTRNAHQPPGSDVHCPKPA